MALWYLINDTQYGLYTLRAGKLINDAIYNTAKIEASGGVLWPASDPVVAAAAANITLQKRRGVPSDLLAILMQSAVEAAQNSNIAGANAGASIYAVVQKFTATIGFAALTAAATTQVISPAAFLLPANTRIIGHEINGTAAFTGGGLTTMTIAVGGNGSNNEIVSSQSVFTAVGLVAGTSGANPQGLYATATQIGVLFTGSGNVNSATAGSVTIDLLAVVLP
jgi:hypothetical protein